MRILLVRAANDPENFGWTYDDLPPLLRKSAFVPPLALATLAALTPDDIEVRIWDEHARGPVTDFAGFDLVGITAYSSQLPRARALAATVRAAGIMTVIGGPGPTSDPEGCRDDFDIVFVGEAETTWPEFLADLREGRRPHREYRPLALPDMAQSPPPRWDALVADMPAYVAGPVQVSRGCPFDCEFCGVWQTFGRKMRTKPIDQVIDEIQALQQLGARSILFCSDNFYGAPKYAKALLHRLLDYNRTLTSPLIYSAELDINISRDDEILALLADTGFASLLIGIESPNKESLVEMRKRQNLRGDLITNIHRVQSFGVPIDGSIVVGFDHDTTAIFDEMFEFLQESNMPLPRPHMLKAIPGTELHKRLVGQNRVIDSRAITGAVASEYLDAVVYSNVVPAGMSRAELVAGYGELVRKIFDWDNFSARLLGFVEGVTREPAGWDEAVCRGYAAMMRGQRAHLPVDLADKYDGLVAKVEQSRPYMLPSVARSLLRYTFELRRVAQTAANTRRQLAAMGASDLVTA